MTEQKIILNQSEIINILDKFRDFSTPLILNDGHQYNIKTQLYLVNLNTYELILRPYDLETPFLLGPSKEIMAHNQNNNIFFPTKVLKGTRSFFIKLKIPHKLELLEKREQFREEFREQNFQVYFNNYRTLSLSKDSILHQAKLLNINEKGIFLKSNERSLQNFRVGDKIVFTSIQDYPIKKKITGTIRSLSTKGHKNFFLGIEFSERLEINNLIEYLEELSGYSHPKLRELLLEELRSSHGKLTNSSSFNRNPGPPH